MDIKSLSLTVSALALSTSVNAALIERLGGLAYYDDVADLTWLADALSAQTSGYDNDGAMTWADANAWAAGLDVAGVTGWRLPDTNPIDGTTADDATLSFIGTEDSGTNVSAPGTLYAGSQENELAYLFYNTLGNLSYCDSVLSTTSSCIAQSGNGLTNTGPFSNLQSNYYWSATEYAPVTGNAWLFGMISGDSNNINKAQSFFAWAVHSGDVSAVPVPAAAWLFGSGLLGLVGMARRKKA